MHDEKLESLKDSVEIMNVQKTTECTDAVTEKIFNKRAILFWESSTSMSGTAQKFWPNKTATGIRTVNRNY